jgi:two-component system sensor kinase FixL
MNEQHVAALTSADRDVLFRTVIETAVDGIVVIDARGRMMLYNRAAERLFGYTAEEVLGRNVSMLMPEPYRGEHDAYVERYLKTGEARIIGIGREVTALRKDGSTFPMYLSVGEGWLGDTRIFLGLIHDMTARKRDEQQVHELQNELMHALRLTAMGQLTSALAHELNQPLTAVMNYLNAARRGLAASEDPAAGRAGELLEKAVAQTARAGQIIRRLRGFIEKKEPDRTPEDLNASVEEAIALGLVGAADRNVTVKTELQSDLPPVLFDRIQIQQVMVNLMRNAIEALEGHERREIAITTAMPGGDFVEVGVADSGPGIAPEMMAHLFQPFSTSKPSGLGMGLSICRGIVERHGGRLWVASNPGGGALFSFRLPLRNGAEV